MGDFLQLELLAAHGDVVVANVQLSPSSTCCPSLSIRAFMVAFRPVEHTVLISTKVSAQQANYFLKRLS